MGWNGLIPSWPWPLLTVTRFGSGSEVRGSRFLGDGKLKAFAVVSGSCARISCVLLVLCRKALDFGQHFVLEEKKSQANDATLFRTPTSRRLSVGSGRFSFQEDSAFDTPHNSKPN